MLCGSAGLCGGSASGKTTVANKIIEALDVPWVVLLSMDSFYKVREESSISLWYQTFTCRMECCYHLTLQTKMCDLLMASLLFYHSHDMKRRHPTCGIFPY